MSAVTKGVVSRAAWGARPARSRQSFEPPVVGGTTHWEGPKIWGSLWEFGHGTCAAKVRGIQNFHMANGYVDIAYNYIVCPHGFVFEGRGFGVRSGANGTTYANGHSYAICQLRGVGDPFPREMQDATEWTYAHIRFGAGADRKCHRDWVATQCPGDDGCRHTKTFISTPTAPPAPPPTPAPPAPGVKAPPFPGRYMRRGHRGFDVLVAQDRLRDRGWSIGVDGIFGAQTDRIVRAFQREKGLGVDGIIGPQTWRKLWTAPVTR